MGLGKIRKRARTVRDGLAARLVASGLDPRPVSEWVGFLRDHPESRYQRLPGLVRRRCGRLDAKDSGLESLLVRWLLAALAVELRAEDYRLRLPASCASLLPMQVERVLDQIEGLDPSVYRLHREEVAKDLGLLTGRLVCVGYHFIEVSTKPRRKVLFAGGLRQWLRVMRSWGPLAGGLTPVIVTHLHLWSLGERSDEEFVRCSHRCADLLAANPQLVGLTGESWIVDPAIEEVSPHLAKTRRLTLANGGLVLRTGNRARATRLATRSPLRRRLYEEGKYRPAEYLRFWPRTAMIAWSARTRDPDWGPVGPDSRVPVPDTVGEPRL